MTSLTAGQTFPDISVKTLGGDSVTLGAPQDGHDWKLVVVYRGLHCPICKKYVSQLDGIVEKFNDIGVDVVAVSADPEEKAKAFVEETGVTLPVGYGLSLSEMEQLGTYISDPRSPQETDRPFAEPAHFVINGSGKVQILDVSNAPFARPDLDMLLSGVKFVREKDYPVRGTHLAA